MSFKIKEKNAAPEILVVLKFPFSLLLYFSHLSVGWKFVAGEPEIGMVQPVGPAAEISCISGV